MTMMLFLATPGMIVSTNGKQHEKSVDWRSLNALNKENVLKTAGDQLGTLSRQTWCPFIENWAHTWPACAIVLRAYTL